MKPTLNKFGKLQIRLSDLFKTVTLILLPSICYVLFGFSGLFVPSVIAILVFGFLSSRHKNGFARNNLALFLVMSFYTIVAISKGLFLKPFLSYILFVVVIFNSGKIREGLDNMLFDHRIRRLVRQIFILLILLNILVDWDISIYREFNSPFVPFSEPSHFYLTFAIWIIPIKDENKNTFILFALFVIVSAIYIESFLGLLLGLLALFVMYPIWCLFLVIIWGVPFFHYMLGSDNFSQRVLLNQENLTAAVWLLGWQEAWSNALRNAFLGSGFQTLGLNGHSSEYAKQLLRVFTEFDSINLYDGGFLFVKLFSEFGILSLVFIAKIFRYLWEIRFLSLALVFSIDMFLRGTGYGSLPFIISFIFYISREKKYV